MFPDRAGTYGEDRKQGVLAMDNKEVMSCFV